MRPAKGTIQSRARMIIPILLYVSKTRITNGNTVSKANTYRTSGLMYSIHITPFIMISFTIPVSRFRIEDME